MSLGVSLMDKETSKALEEIAFDLIDQRNEPWTLNNGLSHDRVHYWRDKAIEASRRIKTIIGKGV